MQQRAGKACRPLAPRAWKRLQERGGTGYRTVRVRAGTEDANGAAHMTILSIRIVGRRTRAPGLAARRSEEHTSELQSLMRISYAVFCLKKKISPNNYRHYLTRKQHIVNKV